MRQLIEKYKTELIVGRILGESILGASVIVGGLVGLMTFALSPSQEQTNFNNAYSSAFEQYADQNHDGVTTTQEKSQFLIDVYKGKNVQLYKSEIEPRTLKGERIPLETLTQWFNNYKPANTEVPYK